MLGCGMAHTNMMKALDSAVLYLMVFDRSLQLLELFNERAIYGRDI